MFYIAVVAFVSRMMKRNGGCSGARWVVEGERKCEAT